MANQIGDRPRNITDELDRQLFNLKTLYDVSHELLGMADVRQILKTFLLMTMGNFGAIQGFIMTQDLTHHERIDFEPVGFYENDHLLLEELADQLLRKSRPEGVEMLKDILRGPKTTMPEMVCVAAFKVDDRCSGLMGLGRKLIDQEYTEEDKDLLATLVNNLVVSLKNARYSEALLKALEEVRVLNSAKDKVISHLSHELMTPVALINGCLKQLEKRLNSLPPETWENTLTRAKRAVQRLAEIQYEATDIMDGEDTGVYQFFSKLLDLCSDELEHIASEELGQQQAAESIRGRIEELFGPRKSEPEDVFLHSFTAEKLEEMRPLHATRQIELRTHLEEAPAIRIPLDPLEKIVRGLIRNAIENTPNGGKIEVRVENEDKRVELSVRDYGVGIVVEHQARIFEGFFPTQDTMLYASRKAFEFNAGGRGADLLRMKIFSERYGFALTMTSSRCRHIPSVKDLCPGRISECKFCKEPEDCYHSGGTIFSVAFPVR